ncbi:hypothetical protein [Rhizobium phage RHph_X2_24]|nr:hypothetical protein [Rhizobium phage RHph_X2_24]
MCDAIAVQVRYDTKDENGETRRQRNDRFEVASPPLVIPSYGRYLWDWYDELSNGVIRTFDGVCHPIPWTEFHAWLNVTGNIVHSSEFEILRDMDRAFCAAMNDEFEAYRQRQRDKLDKK